MKVVTVVLPKLFDILPKVLRTRTYSGSLIGQINIFVKLSFFEFHFTNYLRQDIQLVY